MKAQRLQSSTVQEVASASGVFAQSARKRYSVREVPLSEKNATSVQRCKRLGALVDGRDGRVAVPPGKSGLIAMLTAHVLSQEISRKDLQVVAGHWCYLGCLRRECCGVFSQVWSLINNWGRPSTKRHLPPGVKAELFLALGQGISKKKLDTWLFFATDLEKNHFCFNAETFNEAILSIH